MPKKSPHLQSCAIPFAWEDGELLLGLVTPFRGKNWVLPKVSVAQSNCPANAAADESLRAGGFVGLVDDEPLLVQNAAKRGSVAYFPLEISGLLENWEAQRHRRRKLVPLARIEKFVADRAILRIIRTLAEERLDLELVA